MRAIKQLTNNEKRKRTKMKLKCISGLVLAMMLVAVSSAYAQQRAGVLLQSGLYKEEVKGDLEAAIQIYERILKDFPKDRPVAAKVLLHIGPSYERLGKQEAQKAHRRLIEESADQGEVVARAHDRLAALEHVPVSETVVGMQLREVWPYSGLGELDVIALSRDGRYCTFFIDTETSDLAVRDLTTGKDERLTENTDPRLWLQASISPDNKWVAYHAGNRKEGFELRIVRIDDTQQRILYPNKEKSRVMLRGWDPDSQHSLATFYDSDRSRRIATVSVADGSIRVLKKLSPEGYNISNPRFSPDGRYVAYGRVMDRASRQEDIFLIPLDGGPEIHLIEHPADDDVLGWTPDGKKFLFRSDRRGEGDDAWMIHVVDGRPRGVPRLVKKGIPKLLEGPVCTPTGGWAFYHWERASERTQDTARRQAWQLRMLKIFVSPESAKASCLANLRKINKAIEKYKKQHGDVPHWLSDLHADYLQDTTVLLCPAGTPLRPVAEDPKMPCSYLYAFNPTMREGIGPLMPVIIPAEKRAMTWKQVKQLQMKYYGGVVPIVHCRHHRTTLWLSYDGEVYEVPGPWEASTQAITGLFSQLKKAVEVNPEAWAQRYDMFGCMSVLAANRDRDIAKLAELLREHLEMHPDLTSEGAEELLAALGKLRFVTRSEDDAEEFGDGQMYLNSSDLELVTPDRLDLAKIKGDKLDQVVGIRFQSIQIPKGAEIKKAYLQFIVDEVSTEQTDLTIHAELADNAEAFRNVDHNITSRPKTSASVKWSPEPWGARGERSEKQRTPDLSALIQEVIAQPGWQEGNALVLIISGSGKRVAESYDGDQQDAPMLYTEY